MIVKRPSRHRGVRPANALVPMIDVVFLLLVYFLQTSTYIPPEGALRPALEADSERGTASADFQPLIVEVAVFDGREGFRLGPRVLFDADELRAVLEPLPKHGGVFVKGSDDISVAPAAAALQAARDAGFLRVTYVPAR
ncbi:MAG: biopolymer transporter ExbD [Planctomycetota bacterium]